MQSQGIRSPPATWTSSGPLPTPCTAWTRTSSSRAGQGGATLGRSESQGPSVTILVAQPGLTLKSTSRAHPGLRDASGIPCASRGNAVASLRHPETVSCAAPQDRRNQARRRGPCPSWNGRDVRCARRSHAASATPPSPRAPRSSRSPTASNGTHSAGSLGNWPGEHSGPRRVGTSGPVACNLIPPPGNYRPRPSPQDRCARGRCGRRLSQPRDRPYAWVHFGPGTLRSRGASSSQPPGTMPPSRPSHRRPPQAAFRGKAGLRGANPKGRS